MSLAYTNSERRLLVRHETHYAYDAPVEVAHHSAWLRPRNTAWQAVLGWQLHIDPEPECAVYESLDAFGNWRHGFSHSRVHRHLSVVSTFEASLQPGPVWDAAALQRSPPCASVAQALRYGAGVQQPDAVGFALGTAFAPISRSLADFAGGLHDGARPLLEFALALMAHVNQSIVYAPQSTSVATSAPQVLAQGRGVCQDFAHLMIAVLRSLGLAASYVSGYLLTEAPPGQPRLVGADASHAWVGVWCPVHGWVALDPTNNVVVGQDHVTLAWGRDYADVAPLRGVIRGGGDAPPRVAVSVEPIG